METIKIKYFDKELDTVIPIPGYHMIYNAMAASSRNSENEGRRF